MEGVSGLHHVRHNGTDLIAWLSGDVWCTDDRVYATTVPTGRVVCVPRCSCSPVIGKRAYAQPDELLLADDDNGNASIHKHAALPVSMPNSVVPGLKTRLTLPAAIAAAASRDPPAMARPSDDNI
jgi:hypothetical protein